MPDLFNPTVGAILAHKNLKKEIPFTEHLLNLIAEDSGTNTDGLIDQYANDAIVPGICSRRECLAIHDSCEPDARNNSCEECGNDSVRSFLDIMEVI